MISRAVKAFKAIKITFRLDFRIRLSYACAQLTSVSCIGLRLGRIDQSIGVHRWLVSDGKNSDAAAKLLDRKTNFPPVMRTLKNTADGRWAPTSRLWTGLRIMP
jgi:hypothetical protein